MNTATAHREQPNLSIVGGSSGRGRPPSDELTTKRAETRAQLERWGMFDAANNRRSKAFNSWSAKDCDASLTWAQKQVAKNGGVVTKVTDPEPEVDLVEEEYFALLAGATFEGEEPAPVVSLYFIDPFILARESWVFPYFREVVLWEACLKAREEAERYRLLLEIERENMDAVLGPLMTITKDPEYRASLDDIIFLVTLDKGRPVRDFHLKCQTLMVDAFSRDEPKYKGKVKLVFTSSYDSPPSDGAGAAYSVEVKEETPPFVSGGRLYHDKKGKVLTAADAYQQLPLGQAGGSESAQAAQ